MFFKDEIYSFAIGNNKLIIGTNGLIISKKILVTIGMITFIFAVLFWRISNIYADVVWTDLTWR